MLFSAYTVLFDYFCSGFSGKCNLSPNEFLRSSGISSKRCLPYLLLFFQRVPLPINDGAFDRLRYPIMYEQQQKYSASIPMFCTFSITFSK